MASFSVDIANDGNKLVTLLGSQIPIIEKFLLQSDNVALDATIHTLVIKFDQGKYEELLLTNSL